MYVNLSVMTPNPGHDAATADSMQRFAAAARAQPGCVLCATFRDQESGKLYGLGVWESEQASADGGAACMSAVADDDFDVLVADMENHRLIEL
jgi:Antibiotic biosynthesis monooxygenase